MSKNIQATFWAGIALLSVIVGVLAVERQLPARPARPAVHKTFAPSPIVKFLTDIFVPNIATIQTPANTTTATTTVTSRIPRRKPKPVVKQLSYGDAVVQYANTRIQFGPTCLANPGQMVAANGITIMLDNRSSVTQTITVAGKSYIVSAYGYALVTLKEKILPYYFYVNCNGQKNAVEIALE